MKIGVTLKYNFSNITKDIIGIFCIVINNFVCILKIRTIFF